MPIDEYTRDAAGWLLEFAGEPATLVTQTVDDHDEYGDPIYSVTEVETEAEIIVRGTPDFERRIEGVDSDVNAVAWILADHTVYTGDESDDQGPTTVETDTHSFDVYAWFDEGNGKIRLHLEE